jgi:hypothetical protein
MKVKDLIEQLGYMDQEAEVHFSYNYGDHWRTQVAPTVDTVEEGMVKHSAYHSMDKMVDEEEFDYDDTGEPTYGKDVRRVVVLG